MLPLRHLLALLLLGLSVFGCGTTARTRERLDYLVKIGATKDQIIAEYGEPESVSAGVAGETVMVFVSKGRSSTRTVTKTVNGVAATETITTSTPGKLRLVLVFRENVLIRQSVQPNR